LLLGAHQFIEALVWLWLALTWTVIAMVHDVGLPQRRHLRGRNLVAVIVIARLTISGFASVWCGWAAVSSAAIALHCRLARPGPHHAGTRLPG
jgi:hypothetical protein